MHHDDPYDSVKTTYQGIILEIINGKMLLANQIAQGFNFNVSKTIHIKFLHSAACATALVPWKLLFSFVPKR